DEVVCVAATGLRGSAFPPLNLYTAAVPGSSVKRCRSRRTAVPGTPSSGSRDRDLACELRVLRDQILVRALRAAPALAVQVREDERRHRLPGDLLVACGRERPLDQRLDVVERLVGRPADEEAGAAQLPVCVRDAGCLLRRLDATRDRRPAGRRIE